MPYLQPYEGTPARVQTEDGIEYRPTFFVRMIESDDSFIIFGHRFQSFSEADEFCATFDWTKLDQEEWHE